MKRFSALGPGGDGVGTGTQIRGTRGCVKKPRTEREGGKEKDNLG